MQLLGMTEPGSVPRDTALCSLEYRSGRAIRRNSNELLPLPAFPLANTFHRAAVPGNGSPLQRGPNPPHQRQLRGSCSFEHHKRDDSQRLPEVAEGLGMELLPALTYGQRWATGKLLWHGNTSKAALQPWLQAGGQHCNQHLGFKLSKCRAKRKACTAA